MFFKYSTEILVKIIRVVPNLKYVLYLKYDNDSGWSMVKAARRR